MKLAFHTKIPLAPPPEPIAWNLAMTLFKTPMPWITSIYVLLTLPQNSNISVSPDHPFHKVCCLFCPKDFLDLWNRKIHSSFQTLPSHQEWSAQPACSFQGTLQKLCGYRSAAGSQPGLHHRTHLEQFACFGQHFCNFTYEFPKSSQANAISLGDL